MNISIGCTLIFRACRFHHNNYSESWSHEYAHKCECYVLKCLSQLQLCRGLHVLHIREQGRYHPCDPSINKGTHNPNLSHQGPMFPTAWLSLVGLVSMVTWSQKSMKTKFKQRIYEHFKVWLERGTSGIAQEMWVDQRYSIDIIKNVKIKFRNLK